MEPIPRDWKEEEILAYLLQRYGTNRKYTDFYMKHMLNHHKENPLFDLYMESELGSLKRSRVFVESLCHNFGSLDYSTVKNASMWVLPRGIHSSLLWKEVRDEPRGSK